MVELDPGVASTGTRLIVCETLDSTNAEALRLARAGERGPLWVVARTQTKGRGRRGRQWVSAPGNLFTSLLVPDSSAPEHRAELCFVAALAIHDTVAIKNPSLSDRLAIKWPNDLLLDGRKFAGILIEADQFGEGGAIVIGIGINCASHPSDTDYPSTDLASAGGPIGVDALFPALSLAMPARIAQWNNGNGFPAIRAAWLTRAVAIGSQIRVRLPTQTLTGCFESIDQAGHLVLRMSDNSLETIAAGEILISERAAAPAEPLAQ